MSTELTARQAITPGTEIFSGVRVGHAALALSVVLAGFVALFPLGVEGDYPNHLARTYIEGWLGAASDLARYYEVDWRFIPNLTMDLTVPWLSHLIGVYRAGDLVIVLAMLSGPLAGVWLSRRLHGGCAQWLSLIGFAVIFGTNLEFGFINSIVTTGLGLAAFALWVGVAPGWRRSLFFAPIGLFLVANHAIGFVFFGYIVLLWEIACFVQKERGDLRAFLAGLFVRDAVAFLPGVVYLACAVFSASDLYKAPGAFYAPWDGWAYALISPFLYYATPASIVVACLSAISIYGGFAVGWRSGLLQIDKRMSVVCFGVLLLLLLMPARVLGIWGMHFRYPAALIILLAASVRFAPGARRAAGAAAGALAVILIVQFSHAVINMMRVDTATAQLRAALAGLPKGAVLLPVIDPDADSRIADHTPSLAVIEADAYVPGLFTNTSPVNVRPAMRALHMPQMPVYSAQLAEGLGKPLPPSENGYWSRRFYYDWPAHFTHVLYMRAPFSPGLGFPQLCATASSPDFVLYTVRRQGETCTEKAVRSTRYRIDNGSSPAAESAS